MKRAAAPAATAPYPRMFLAAAALDWRMREAVVVADTLLTDEEATVVPAEAEETPTEEPMTAETLEAEALAAEALEAEAPEVEAAEAGALEAAAYTGEHDVTVRGAWICPSPIWVTM